MTYNLLQIPTTGNPLIWSWGNMKVDITKSIDVCEHCLTKCNEEGDCNCTIEENRLKLKDVWLTNVSIISSDSDNDDIIIID